MLELRDVYKTDKTIKGLQTGLNTLWQQRNEFKDTVISKGVENFIDCFKSQDIKAEFTPVFRGLYESNRQGAEFQRFDFNNETCCGLDAKIPLGSIGHLTYNVSFVKSVSFNKDDESWTRVQGTGEITALIKSSVHIKTGDEFKNGRAYSFSALHLNVAHISDTLSRTASKVSEDILRNAASEYLTEFNESREQHSLIAKGMRDLIDEREEKLSDDFKILQNRRELMLTEAITNGITRKEFEDMIRWYEMNTDVDDDGNVLISDSYSVTSHSSRNLYLSLFNHEETEAVRIEKPKRKNSKNQDVYRRYKGSNDEINVSFIDCNDFKHSIWVLSNHMASEDLIRYEGASNLVKS